MLNSEDQEPRLHLSQNAQPLNSALSWHRYGDIHVKGYVYSEKTLLMRDSLAELFLEVTGPADFRRRVESMNGYFAVIIDTQSAVYAAVDRINSTPLHYRTDAVFEVGDNYKGFLEKGEKISSTSVMQYLSAGYVLGEDTLLENVKQLSAGNALIFEKRSKSTKLLPYFRYVQNDSATEKTSRTLEAELHDVHLSIFGRMVASLKERQAIVPLSGGYDSRLIVEMLHHFGHENTLCVSWGHEDYWQVQIAQQVAKSLNFQWVRVESKYSDWARWYKSGQICREMEFCGALASIPYVQDNLIFDRLKEKELLQEDAIFISGNSGDFIEGEHIISLSAGQNDGHLLEAIIKKHMRLARKRSFSFFLEPIKADMSDFLNEFGTIEGFDEFWEWKERQSKFVSNSIKPFEAMGFEWRLPFWDLELMNFWSSVPRQMKAGRRLFYAYAEKFMYPNLPHANPSLSKFRKYSEALRDGRYGCYEERGFVQRLFKKNHSLVKADLREFITPRPLGLTRFGGLLAMDVCDQIIDRTRE